MTFRDTENFNSEFKLELEGSTNRAISQSVAASVRSFLKQFGEGHPEDLFRLVMDEVEKPLLQEVLRYTGGNQCRSAEILGISRGTLRKKIKSYGLAS